MLRRFQLLAPSAYEELASVAPNVSNGAQLLSDVHRLMHAAHEVTLGHLCSPGSGSGVQPTVAKVNAVSDILGEFGNGMLSRVEFERTSALMRHTIMWSQDAFRLILLQLMLLGAHFAADGGLARAERVAYRRLLAAVTSSLITFAHCIGAPDTPTEIKRGFRNTVCAVARCGLLAAITRLVAVEMAEAESKVRKERGLPPEPPQALSTAVPAAPGTAPPSSSSAAAAAAASAPKHSKQRAKRRGAGTPPKPPPAAAAAAPPRAQTRTLPVPAAAVSADEEDAAVAAAAAAPIETLVFGLGVVATLLQSLAGIDPPSALSGLVRPPAGGADGAGAAAAATAASGAAAGSSTSQRGSAPTARGRSGSSRSGSSGQKGAAAAAAAKEDPRLELIAALRRSNLLEHAARRLLLMAAARGDRRARSGCGVGGSSGDAAAAAAAAAAASGGASQHAAAAGPRASANRGSGSPAAQGRESVSAGSGGGGHTLAASAPTDAALAAAAAIAAEAREPLREGEAFEAALKSIMIILQDTVGSFCSPSAAAAADLAGLVCGPCLQHLLGVRLVQALHWIDGAGASGLQTRYTAGLPPMAHRLTPPLRDVPVPVPGSAGGGEGNSGSTTGSSSGSGGCGSSAGSGGTGGNGGGDRGGAGGGGERGWLLDFQAATTPLDVWNVLFHTGASGEQGPDAVRARIMPYSPAAVHALCVRTANAMLTSVRLWQQSLVSDAATAAAAAATQRRVYEAVWPKSAARTFAGSACSAVMAEGLTVVTATSAVIVADRAARLLPSEAWARRRDAWWAAAVECVQLAVSYGLSSVETMAEKAGQTLAAMSQRLGAAAARMPGTLPRDPPPEVSAALRAGVLPCLERALRRELSAAPPALRSVPVDGVSVPRPSTPPTPTTLAAALAPPALAWPQLGWLLAYGDVRQAAALVATVGKLMTAACRASAAAASPPWAATSSSASASAEGGGGTSAGLPDGLDWRTVAALLRPMNDLSRSVLMWLSTSPEGLGDGNSSDGGGAAAAAGGGPGRQLRVLASYLVLQWMPVWCDLARVCCDALPNAAAVAAFGAAFGGEPARTDGLASLRAVTNLSLELALPYLGSALRWSLADSPPPQPGAWAREQWLALLSERGGADVIATTAKVLAAADAGLVSAEGQGGVGKDVLVGLLTHIAISLPGELRTALVKGCGGTGPLLPVVSRLFKEHLVPAKASPAAATALQTVAQRPGAGAGAGPADATSPQSRDAEVGAAAVAMLGLLRSVMEGKDLTSWRKAVAASAAAAAAAELQFAPPGELAAHAAAFGVDARGADCRLVDGGGIVLLPAEARRLLRRCSNPGCVNLSGDSEADLERGLQRCTGCGGAWYCGRACQKAHWEGGHKEACKWGRAKHKGAAAEAKPK